MNINKQSHHDNIKPFHNLATQKDNDNDEYVHTVQT